MNTVFDVIGSEMEPLAALTDLQVIPYFLSAKKTYILKYI